MIKHKDFEDFLMWEFHKDEGRGYLDDDLPDAFDSWIVDLDLQDLIDYGDKYGEWCYKMGDIKVSE